MRRINLMAGSVGGAPRDLVPIDAGDLVQRAASSLAGMPTGDLGDPHWQNRFEDLVAAVDASGMHVVGRLMTKQELLRSLRSDDVDVDLAAQLVCELFTAALNGSVDLRQSGAVPAERFVDVHYTRLVRDPAATLGAACEQMGLRFTDGYASAVADYLAHKPKGKFGVHRYQPEDWGFTAEGLRTAMAPHLDHFGVAREG